MQWIHGFKHTRGFQGVVGGITDLSIIRISETELRSVLGAKRREYPNVQEPSPLRSEGTTKEYENPPCCFRCKCRDGIMRIIDRSVIPATEEGSRGWNLVIATRTRASAC